MFFYIISGIAALRYGSGVWGDGGLGKWGDGEVGCGVWGDGEVGCGVWCDSLARN
ncbi:hypothetical protein [Microcystis aeruginosa]|uniref:hypothetical protein n=1 Tax=Microcystis aeruginosa TaxID=1126 RepID=UPI0013051794|nr:hypothetical protein [Microcystis aeruginosa]